MQEIENENECDGQCVKVGQYVVCQMLLLGGEIGVEIDGGVVNVYGFVWLDIYYVGMVGVVVFICCIFLFQNDWVGDVQCCVVGDGCGVFF